MTGTARALKVGLATALAPFRHPTFLAVWVATLSSNLGGMIQTVGASWLMTSMSGSSSMVGLVQTASTMPIMLFSLAAGAFADLFDRRKVMLAAQIGMLAASAALAGLAYSDMLSPWLLIAMTFLVGSGLALNGPAWQASVGELVPRSELSAAIALNATGFNVARSAGPALGGVIVAAAGAAAAFLLNALSYLALIAVLSGWKRNSTTTTLPAENVSAAIITGLRFVRFTPLISRILFRGLGFGLGGSAAWAMLPVIVRDNLNGDSVAYGFLLGAFGTGAIGGALFSAQLRALFGPESVVRWALIASAAATLLAGLSAILTLTAAALVLAGVGWVLTLSTCNATVQLLTPRWVVARTLAIYQTFAFGGLAIGSWAWGVIVDHSSILIGMTGAAAVLVASALLGTALPLASEAMIDLSPGRSERMAQSNVSLADGRIVARNRYEIGTPQLPDFLSLAAELRLVRLRNGARRWRIDRDVRNPDCWVEEFVMASAIEHQRLYRRMTVSDLAVENAILALTTRIASPS